MRHNNRIHMDRYDRIYIDIPQCKWLHSIVAVPLKTIYYNATAERNANVVRVCNDVYDLDAFCVANGIPLF